MKPPFLSDVQLPSSVAVAESFNIALTGNWPNPSWQHIDTKIDLDTDQLRVTISYLGQSGGGLAIQVLQPVRVLIPLSLPSAGVWTVEITGRAQTLSRTITVIS